MKKNLTRKMSLITIVICVVFSVTIGMEKSEKIKEAKSLIERADVIRDLSMYNKAYAIFDSIIRVEPENGLALYYRAYIEYRFLVMGLSKEYEKFFDIYIDSAVAHSNKLTNIKGFDSEAYTLLAYIYSMKIAKFPAKAPVIASEINENLEMAEKINPENPRALMMKGIIKLKTPVMYGGSIDEAFVILKKTVSVYEKQNNDSTLEISWGYLDALAWLGSTLISLNKYDEAEFIFRKALDTEPDYGWIKYVLLPDLEKKKLNK